MSDIVIEVENVTKVYQQNRSTPTVALDGVSLSVRSGEVFALLGLNGAGKTTLVKILLGLRFPTGGSALVMGEAPLNRAVKRNIGYLPETVEFPGEMSGKDVLKLYGSVSGLSGKELKKRIGEVIDLLDLGDAGGRKVKTYSKGMLIRLGLAQAVIHKPKLLFLDEPTEGLDPSGRRKVRNLIRQFAADSCTVFLNSHTLSEVEMVADRVGILHKGKLVASGKLTELMPDNEQYLVLVGQEPELANNYVIEKRPDGWEFAVRDGKELAMLLDELAKAQISVQSIRPARTTLEEVFFKYISEDSDA
ncbi:MAG: ATP-binding cassette domain-containing protein [Bacteroidota bacterium]